MVRVVALPGSACPRLVGREREQQRLGALLTAAENGQGHLVLIGGEAGIGKTALVRVAHRRGCRARRTGARLVIATT